MKTEAQLREYLDGFDPEDTVGASEFYAGFVAALATVLEDEKLRCAARELRLNLWRERAGRREVAA